MSPRRPHLGVAATSLLVLVLMSLPLVVLFGVSLNASSQQLFPPQGLSLRWYANILSRHGFIDAIVFSLELAVAATIISLAAATLAALAIVRHRFWGRDLLLTLLLSPLIVPQVVVGIAFLISLAALRIHSSAPALLALHVVLALPFALRVLVASLTRFNLSLEDAARSLGAPPWKAFLVVTLPIIRPGLIAAAVFAFAASFENFTASQFLVWDRSTLPVEIYNYVQTENDPTGAAMSGLVVLTVGALVIALNRYIGLDALAER